MGASSLWRTKAGTTLFLRLFSGLLAGAFVFANLYAVRNSVVSLVLPRRVANIEIGEEVPGRYMVGAAAIISVVLGAFLTIGGDEWTTLALWRIGLPFNEADPYFQTDLGYFVYWLPLERALYVWSLIVVLVVAAVVVFLYALTPSLRWERGTLYVSNYVRRHFAVLGCLLLLVLAWSYRLDTFDVLLHGSGSAGAFGYADHRANIPVNGWLAVLTLVAAFVVLWFGFTGQVRVAVGAVVAILLISFGLRQAGPPLARRFAASTDPQVRERPYLATRADYTRRAYAIDRIERADSTFGYGSPASMARGVPTWDASALSRAITRLGRGERIARSVGWQATPSGVVAELPLRPSGERADDSWALARVLAFAADGRGDPVRVTATGTLARDDERLTRVLVSDSATGYTIVSDSIGTVAAAELRSGLSRLAHAWSLQNFRLLFGDLPQPAPRLVMRRGARERVRHIVPFLAQGTTLYPVVAADTLYWMLHLYAASATYPLSERLTMGEREVSYLHHAALGVVNAHTGRVVVIPDSAREPVTESWMQAFPRLFGGWSHLPERLAGYVPPAVDAARAQAEILARYGLRGETARRGAIPADDGADTLFVDDHAPLLDLPRSELVLDWTIPVLDSLGSVTGTVVASGGQTPRTAWLPLRRRGMRWAMVVEQLQRSLDSTITFPQNARAARGQVRAVPVAADLAFVQPTYSWRLEGAPTLVQVTVLTRDRIRVGPTLAAALGVPPGQPSEELAPMTPADFRARVSALYEEMTAALQRGDWVAFGRAYEALGALIARGTE
jgi:uncharacterized membrane protein (UPF0182 family)